MQKYEYISTIGEGTYGVVWKCRDKVSGRLVAVKAFKEAHRDRVALKLAVREAKVLSMIKHPNIVKMTASYRSKSGRLYLVLEYIEATLQDLLNRAPRGLPAVLTKILCWQLLYAVAYLHQRKILHRDIKPDNILVTNKGVLKLCDFGFARHTLCEPRHVQHCTQYITTRWYRSPEVLIGDKYGPSSDIWSLGCTIAEMATGRPLFAGHSSTDQLWRMVRCLGPLPPCQAAIVAANPELHDVVTSAPNIHKTLRQHLPELEPEVFHLVESCLCLDPMQRPTAQEMLQWPYFEDVGHWLAEVAHGSLITTTSTRPASAPAAATSALESAISKCQTTATNKAAMRMVTVSAVHDIDGCNSIEQQQGLELAPRSGSMPSSGGGTPSMKVQQVTVPTPAQQAQVPFISYVRSISGTTATAGAISQQPFLNTKERARAWGMAAARRRSADTTPTRILDDGVTPAAVASGTLAVEDSTQNATDMSRAVIIPVTTHELDQTLEGTATINIIDSSNSSHGNRYNNFRLPFVISRRGLITSSGDPAETVDTTSTGNYFLSAVRSGPSDTQQPSVEWHASGYVSATIIPANTTSEDDGGQHGVSTSCLANTAETSFKTQSAPAGGQDHTNSVPTHHQSLSVTGAVTAAGTKNKAVNSSRRFGSGNSGHNSYSSSEDSKSNSTVMWTCSVGTHGFSNACPAVDEADESDWCGNNSGKCGSSGGATAHQQSTADGQRVRLQLGSGRFIINGLQRTAARLLRLFSCRGSIKSSMKPEVSE